MYSCPENNLELHVDGNCLTLITLDMFQKAEARVILPREIKSKNRLKCCYCTINTYTLALLIRTLASEQNPQLVCNGSLERESSQNGHHPDIVLC